MVFGGSHPKSGLHEHGGPKREYMFDNSTHLFARSVAEFVSRSDREDGSLIDCNRVLVFERLGSQICCRKRHGNGSGSYSEG